MPDFLIKQFLYVAVPLVAKQLSPFLTVEAKTAAVTALRALDKKTETKWDDIAVELLAAAWSVK